MKRLQPTALIIFFLQGLFVAVLSTLLIVPLGFVFALPATLYALITANKDTLLFLAPNITQTYLIFTLYLPFIWAFLHYYAYTYSAEKARIVIHKGFFWRQTTHIPFQSIEKLTLHQGPLMQLLNLAEIRVHTRRHQKVVEKISGMTLDEAQQIRDRFQRMQEKA